MPEGMSEERKKLIKALGAELVLIPDEQGLAGAVETVEKMAAEDPKIYVPQQFENPENPRVHYEQTAPELWHQMTGDISCFVAGVGSGGTLQGVGKFLKEHKPDVKIIAVEPKDVSAILGHEPGLHQIQGIGDGFIPAVLDVYLVRIHRITKPTRTAPLHRHDSQTELDPLIPGRLNQRLLQLVRCHTIGIGHVETTDDRLRTVAAAPGVACRLLDLPCRRTAGQQRPENAILDQCHALRADRLIVIAVGSNKVGVLIVPWAGVVHDGKRPR